MSLFEELINYKKTVDLCRAVMNDNKSVGEKNKKWVKLNLYLFVWRSKRKENTALCRLLAIKLNSWMNFRKSSSLDFCLSLFLCLTRTDGVFFSAAFFSGKFSGQLISILLVTNVFFLATISVQMTFSMRAYLIDFWGKSSFCSHSIRNTTGKSLKWGIPLQ